MSVTLTFVAGMTALQRVQPLDPSFQIDYSGTLVGDASGGTATITAQIAADIAVIPEYVAASNNNAAATECRFQLTLGVIAGPAAIIQQMLHNVTTVAIDGTTVFDWEPPRTMVIPALGGQATLIHAIENPTAAGALSVHGRLYGWPRNEVIDLPQRTFWPYLTH